MMYYNMGPQERLIGSLHFLNIVCCDVPRSVERTDGPIWCQDAPILRQDAPIWRQDAPKYRQDAPIWRHHGPSWLHLGPTLDHHGPSWLHLNPLLDHLGSPKPPQISFGSPEAPRAKITLLTSQKPCKVCKIEKMTPPKPCKVCKIAKSTVTTMGSQPCGASKTPYVCHLIFDIALALTF